MSETPPRSLRSRLLILVPIVVICIPFAHSLLVPLIPHDAEASPIFLERPDPQHESCVRDTAYMRMHHWELLTHVRDSVMRQGRRGIIGVIGLNKCRECHTSRENFCNHCHDAVNLYPECFGCHYYP